jgi:hypothetical protein
LNDRGVLEFVVEALMDALLGKNQEKPSARTQYISTSNFFGNHNSLGMFGDV